MLIAKAKLLKYKAIGHLPKQYFNIYKRRASYLNQPATIQSQLIIFLCRYISYHGRVVFYTSIGTINKGYASCYHKRRACFLNKIGVNKRLLQFAVFCSDMLSDKWELVGFNSPLVAKGSYCMA